jgi:Flp pilus assembly protein TadD
LAISLLTRVVEESPEFRPALEALGQALLKKGDAAHAILLLERAVKLDPKWPNGRALLGRAYKAAGRTDEANREFNAAQKLSAEERQRLEEKVKGSRKPTNP